MRLTADPNTLDIRPMPFALGAEIACGDLRALDLKQIAAIRQAWLDHLVLLFRGQQLTDDNLVGFLRHFGEVTRTISEERMAANVTAPKNPCVSIVSNVIENGVAIGNLGDGEAVWHSDLCSAEKPYAAALLYALEIPAWGGNTGFSNMYLAFDALPTSLRERIQGLSIKQDKSHNAAMILRRGFSVPTDVRVSPGTSHPIIRTHAETGRNCLYLGRREFAYVNGLTLDASERLLDELWAHATKPDFQWHHEWRVGDVLVWDNRCTLHHRDEFDSASRRILHSAKTAGERPRYLPESASVPPHARGYLRPEQGSS